MKKDYPDVYTIFKLDMDDSEMEMEWVEQLEAGFADEFYFEHHVAYPLMYLYWGEDMRKDVRESESMELFLKLRKKGIRAHSWM